MKLKTTKLYTINKSYQLSARANRSSGEFVIVNVEGEDLYIWPDDMVILAIRMLWFCGLVYARNVGASVRKWWA